MIADPGPGETGRPAASALAAAGWLELQDRLLRSICHDLNGRVGSLHALAYLIEVGEPLPMTFGQEADRIVDAVRRIEMLVGDVEGPGSAFALPELLGRALKAHGHLKDHARAPLRPEVGEGIPPVLVNEARFMRLLLLFIDLACRSTDVEHRVLDVGGDGDGVLVAFDPEDPEACARELPALTPVAAWDRGSLAEEKGRVCLRLPSLARARASASD